MTSLAQPVTGPARWTAVRVAAATLCLIAAVLTIVSTFMPLFEGELSVNGNEASMTVTAWGFETVGGPPIGEMPTNGYPLIFGAIALFCATAVAGFAAIPAASPGTHRVAGLTTAVAAAFLAGTVWTVAVQAASWVDSFGPRGLAPESEDINTTATYEAGFWLLLTALLLSLAAAVLALLPPNQRRRVRPDLYTADMATPPTGFPIPAAIPRTAHSPYAPPPPAQPPHQPQQTYPAPPAPSDPTAPPTTFAPPASAAPPPLTPDPAVPSTPASPPLADSVAPSASAAPLLAVDQAAPPAPVTPPLADPVAPPALAAPPAAEPAAPPASAAPPPQTVEPAVPTAPPPPAADRGAAAAPPASTEPPAASVPAAGAAPAQPAAEIPPPAEPGGEDPLTPPR